MRKLKRLLIVLLLLLTIFVVYVEIANRNTKNMTYRQKVLKAVYPAFMWFTKLTGTNAKKLKNETNKVPVAPFFDLSASQNDGKEFQFSGLKGKKVLLVNTASDCGYTGQYAQLQQLYEQYKEQLVILAFPANDFKEQEKGSDEEIASFCKANYGVTFPVMKKSVVIKSAQQNPVYQWLTDAAKNGWCSQQPSWNFSKYLVNENGVLINYFDPSVAPMSREITDLLR
ncbi:MAG TPA: glutathione peroxidase [Chitinophagaceae bacterium]|nr:glutathione peroxidase [Chitinophagaceae bacterium]